MPAARASAGERNDRAASLIAIVPRAGGKTPVRIFTSVLLPAPLAPISAWTSPGRTLRLAERSATTEPNLLAMSRASRRFAALFMTTLFLLGRVIQPGGIHPVIPRKRESGLGHERGGCRWIPAFAADGFTHFFETAWKFGEKRASHEPGWPITRPLTAPLPAEAGRGRIDGANSHSVDLMAFSCAFVVNCCLPSPLPASLRGEAGSGAWVI